VTGGAVGIVGIVGLGNMGSALAANLVGAGLDVVAHDVAGPDAPCAAVEPVLAGLSDRRRRVGDVPGMAQAVKLLNNFLSATALAATSEAMAFAESVGLDMATVLDVVNVSSGRSAASEDKFADHVVTGTYASGFASGLMAKDVRLYLESVAQQETPAAFGRLTAEVWRRFAEADPDADFTRIHPFVTGGGEA